MILKIWLKPSGNNDKRHLGIFVTFYFKTHPKVGSRLPSRVFLINQIACIGGGGGDGEEEVNRAPRKESEEDDVGVYVLIETDVSCVIIFDIHPI